MKEKISAYIDGLFAPYTGAESAQELKSDLLADLDERFDELVAQGKDEATALVETLDSIGDIEETLGEMAALTGALRRQVLNHFSASSLRDSDFSGLALRGGKFDSSDLKGADFSGADLTGGSFKASSLRGVNFDRADLTDCNFTVLDLREASFCGAVLVRTRFDKSDLGGTRFGQTRLVDCSFSMSDLRGAEWDGCVVEGGDFQGAGLRGLSFEGVTFRGVSLGRADLKRTSFRGAVLQSVSFQPPFALTNKYYTAIKTICFDGAQMDKLTYNSLRGVGANLTGAICL